LDPRERLELPLGKLLDFQGFAWWCLVFLLVRVYIFSF